MYTSPQKGNLKMPLKRSLPIGKLKRRGEHQQMSGRVGQLNYSICSKIKTDLCQNEIVHLTERKEFIY